MSKYSREYGMRLAAGKTWHIKAADCLSPWLDKLASITGLDTSGPNPHSQLLFIPNSPGKEIPGEASRSKLPQNGWSVHDFRALRIWFHPHMADVICEIGPEKVPELDIARMWLSLYPIYHRAQGSGGLPFHAALIERDGVGVLLAGQGNAGKSTCCRRIPPPWQAWCDDEVLVVRDDGKGYQAHPFPTWSDYIFRQCDRTWNVEWHVPLSAIFFLERAEADEVASLGRGQAAVRIVQSTMQVWDKWFLLDAKEKGASRSTCFENACELAKAVPAFLLRVSLKGQFWKEMEKVLP